MLAGIIRSFAELCPDREIVALSGDPSKTNRDHGIRAINRMSPGDVVAGLKEADLVLSGGGSLMQDVTSVRSVLYYLSVIWLAKRMRKKVMVYAQGIGPLNRQTTRRTARSVLSKVDLITVRDTGSKTYLRELGVTAPEVVVTADPSFAVDPDTGDDADEILRAAGVPEGVPVFGVALRPWLVHAHWLPGLARGIETAAARVGATPIFLPMQKDQDLGISVQVASHMTTATSVVANQLSPKQALAVIGKMSMVIGMRLHALIFAARMGVPFLGVAYDPKVEAFVRAAVGESPLALDNLESADVAERILDVWDRRQELTAQADRHVAEFRASAMKNAELACRLLDS